MNRRPNDFNPRRRSKPGHADVCGDDAHAAAGTGDFEVVDAHDFPAVDVDDLFVEEIGDQVKRLVIAGRRLAGCGGEGDGALAIDVGDGVDRRKAQPARGLHDEPVDLRKRVFGLVHEKIGDFPNRKIVDGCPSAHQFRDEPFRERHDSHLIRTKAENP